MGSDLPFEKPAAKGCIHAKCYYWNKYMRRKVIILHILKLHRNFCGRPEIFVFFVVIDKCGSTSESCTERFFKTSNSPYGGKRSFQLKVGWREILLVLLFVYRDAQQLASRRSRWEPYTTEEEEFPSAKQHIYFEGIFVRMVFFFPCTLLLSKKMFQCSAAG